MNRLEIGRAAARRRRTFLRGDNTTDANHVRCTYVMEEVGSRSRTLAAVKICTKSKTVPVSRNYRAINFRVRGNAMGAVFGNEPSAPAYAETTTRRARRTRETRGGEEEPEVCNW